MKLYLDNGYANMSAIRHCGYNAIFVYGGRATGKTYGSLKMVVEENEKFIYMRRTQAQCDLISKPEFSPFKSLNNDGICSIGCKPLSKYAAGFYEQEIDENGNVEYVGEPYGFSCALSTISNMRGFDASDVTLLIYDEFIPEKHERPIKNEGAALLNAYETINRNRELKGAKPLTLLCLANANNLANPIFAELKLIDKVTKMSAKGQTQLFDNKRGIAVFALSDSKISAAKRNTALYHLAEGTDFSEMSLNNQFTADHPVNIAAANLKEYRPICAIGEICIYRHKSQDKYYVCAHKSGSPETFDYTEYGIKQFQAKYLWLRLAYIQSKIYFQSYSCEILLTSCLK